MANEKSLQIIEQIKTLTILELADLVKAIEEEFGVSAAPVAVAGVAAGPAAAAAEEKTEFDVELTSFEADKKLKVIKEIKDITGLGLGEAKALVEGAPKIIKEGASKEEAEALKAKLSEVGATITIFSESKGRGLLPVQASPTAFSAIAGSFSRNSPSSMPYSLSVCGILKMSFRLSMRLQSANISASALPPESPSIRAISA